MGRGDFMKAFIALIFVIFSTMSTAQAKRLTEPVLIPPFAEEIEFPSICEQPMADAVVQASNQDRRAPGGGPVYSPRAFRIKVRGIIYRGSEIVFQAERVVRNTFHDMFLAIYRGELVIEGQKCTVKNVRYYRTARVPMVE